MQTQTENLIKVIELGLNLARVRDADSLQERILLEVRRFVPADTGALYVVDNRMLVCRQVQDDALRADRNPNGRRLFTPFRLPIDSSSVAGHAAATGSRVTIPDVQELESGAAYTFQDVLQRVSARCTVSLMALPLKLQQNTVFGVLELANTSRDASRIEAFAAVCPDIMRQVAETAAAALERAYLTRGILLRMLRLAETHDPTETAAHVNRVAAYAAEIYDAWARGQGRDPAVLRREKDCVRLAAMLHDLGKVTIADAILKKPARLDPVEFEIMKQHSFCGAKLFADSSSELDEAIFHIALEHHERWDGAGYPGIEGIEVDMTAAHEPLPKHRGGIQGENIHPYARATAVADVYDALSSRRCYREPWEESRVLKTIREEAGKQFDPAMVEAFFEVLDVLRNIREFYLDD